MRPKMPLLASWSVPGAAVCRAPPAGFRGGGQSSHWSTTQCPAAEPTEYLAQHATSHATPCQALLVGKRAAKQTSRSATSGGQFYRLCDAQLHQAVPSALRQRGRHC